MTLLLMTDKEILYLYKYKDFLWENLIIWNILIQENLYSLFVFACFILISSSNLTISFLFSCLILCVLGTLLSFVNLHSLPRWCL